MLSGKFGLREALVASAFSMAFVACGDDVTEVTQSGMETVASVKDVKCTSDNEGETVYSRDDGTLYVCSDKKWVDVSGKASEAAASCIAGKEGADSVFVKCGDKVVGLRAPAGTSCIVEKSDAENIYFKCGAETVKVPFPQKSADVDESMAAQLKKVYNKTQVKFFNEYIDWYDYRYFLGSDASYQEEPAVQVWVEELDPKTARPTGKMYLLRGGECGSALLMPSFYYSANVDVSNLISPVVRIRVELGAATVLLRQQKVFIPEQSYYAIANLEEQDVVNVNAATDLKSARIQYLMEKGKTFAEADKQADNDIFEAFGIMAPNRDDSYTRLENYDFAKKYEECLNKAENEQDDCFEDIYEKNDPAGVALSTMGSSLGVQDWESIRRGFAKLGDFSEPYISMEACSESEICPNSEIYVDKYITEWNFQSGRLFNLMATPFLAKYYNLKDQNGDAFKCETKEDGNKEAMIDNKNSRHHGLWLYCRVAYDYLQNPYVLLDILPEQSAIAKLEECSEETLGKCVAFGEYKQCCTENGWHQEE